MKQLTNLWHEIKNFTWTGIQPSTAYDTAWVSTLTDDQNKPIFEESVIWLLNNQNSDGSWGLKEPYSFLCEKMNSTLITLKSLVNLDKNKFSKEIDSGLNWVNENIKNLDYYLKNETVKTVAFELIFPSLLNSLESKVDFAFNIDSYQNLMNHKLSKLPLSLVTNAKTPLLYSVEFFDGIQSDKKINLDYLISRDGSISTSPSATAFYASLKPKSLSYLQFFLAKSKNLDGGWPAYNSGGLFSTVYSLYVFKKAFGFIPRNLRYLLGVLDLNWSPMGIGIGDNFVLPDSDDTSLALKILTDAHYLSPMKQERYWNSLDSYYDEEKGYFRTFPFETDPSFLVNIHIFDALKSNKKKQSQYYDRLLSFLENEILSKKTFSVDKYYFSPYLQNTRALLAFSTEEKYLSDKIITWFLENQREDGLWGVNPNVEELAHVVMALSYYNLHVERIDLTVLNQSIDFIKANLFEKDSQFLWIAKSLFAPTEVITSNIFSSLYLYTQSKKNNLTLPTLKL